MLWVDFGVTFKPESDVGMRSDQSSAAVQAQIVHSFVYHVCGPHRCGKATLVVPITMLMMLKGSVMG